MQLVFGFFEKKIFILYYDVIKSKNSLGHTL